MPMNSEKLAFDRASVRTVDKSGFLHVGLSPFTKEQVVEYWGREIPGWEGLGLEPEKTYKLYRPAEELSKPETIQSINGIPVQFRHHDDMADAPAKATRVGSTGDQGVWKAPYLMNSLHIFDDFAKKAIEDESMRELSLSYWYTPDMTSGEWNGESYDGIMRGIRANHVALVEEGRAGHDVLVSDSLTIHQGDDSMDEKEMTDVAVEEKEDAPVTAEVEEKEEAQDADAGMDAIEEVVNIATKRGLAPEKADAFREAIRAFLEVTAPAEKQEVAVDKEALKACGLDAESPEIQKAFAEGVKFGEKVEKDEPEKLDSEHESEGEKKALGEDADEEEEEEMEAEAVTDECKATDAASIKREMFALFRAHEDVIPTLGKVRLGAYDSADALYAAAFRRETGKAVRLATAKDSYLAYMAGKASVKAVKPTAKDSAPGFEPELAKFLE